MIVVLAVEWRCDGRGDGSDGDNNGGGSNRDGGDGSGTDGGGGGRDDYGSFFSQNCHVLHILRQ